MKLRTTLTLLVVVGLLVPAAAATNTGTNSPTADSGTDAAQSDDAANYTRLYVEDRYKSLQLKPGESDSVEVTVENGEDGPVELSPHVVVPRRGERPIDESWVTIGSGDTTLDAGEQRTFEISVSVPEDAEINRYQGVVAFTDETIQYPGRPARPVHGLSLNVEVWQEPTVRVLSDRYTYAQVKAGDSVTREIVVENTGDQAVPVNPQMETQDRHRPYEERTTFDRSWATIDAPSEIEPGETATIEVTVEPPADVDRGRYRAELDLGLKDPARPEDDTHWQQVSLRFQVWTQPEEPFETAVEVSEDAESVTLELSADRNPRAADGTDPASFDVTFVSPDGEEIDAERVRTTNRGSVNLGADRPRTVDEDATYSTGGERKTFRYRVADPDAGSWTVRVMPENTMHFSYEIVRSESA